MGPLEVWLGHVIMHQVVGWAIAYLVIVEEMNR